MRFVSRTRSLAAGLTVLAAVGIGLVTTELPAAAAAGTWRHENPTINSSWHCGSTDNGAIFSAQNCVIVNGSYWQSAIVVRNRASRQMATEAVSTETDYSGFNTAYNCGQAVISGGTYSVCFGATRKFNPSASNLYLEASGSYLDDYATVERNPVPKFYP